MDIVKELEINCNNICYNGDLGKLKTIIEANRTMLTAILQCKIISREAYMDIIKDMSLQYKKALEKELERQPNWED